MLHLSLTIHRGKGLLELYLVLPKSLSIRASILMRQAGRFLPEYRAVRATVESVLDLAYAPRMAAEVTLQPVRRFGVDAAILFSDILVVPDTLNCKVSFVEGEGPRLDAILEPAGLERLADRIDLGRLGPIFETIMQVKRELPDACAMLGFCGAPWTVASYMIAGRGTPDLDASFPKGAECFP